MRTSRILWPLAAILFIAGCMPGAFAQTQDDDYIRLHVIANSDTDSDQAVKHKVRDAILAQYGNTFAAAQDMDAAEQTIRAELSAINVIAEKTLEKNGMPYGAHSEYGIFSFPTRQYGDCILPAGRYHALKVILGNGEGANWWCVLFPPLCVCDTSAHDKDKEDKTETKESESISTAKKDAPADAAESPAPVKEKESRPKIKFKIVEWVKKLFKK